MIVPKLGEKKNTRNSRFVRSKSIGKNYGDFTSTSIGPMKNPGNKLNKKANKIPSDIPLQRSSFKW